jgi:hypothetical protein
MTLTFTRDTADRVRPGMHLTKNLFVETVDLDPTPYAPPGRLRFTCGDAWGSMDAEPTIVLHNPGEVINIGTKS